MVEAFIALMLQSAAAEVSSAYTELTDCETVTGPAPVNERCQGYRSWTVFIGASDHSAGLAYSERARDAQLNQRPITSGVFQTFSSTIEWRVRRGAGDWTAFATIHRWSSATPVFDEDSGDFSGETRTEEELLVVSALRPSGPIGACHAGYVDVRSVHDANTVARAFADLMADGFRCGVDEPYRIGAGEAARLIELGRL